MSKEIILILDFGSPYTQLIAQRVRENHVFCRIVPYNISAKDIELEKPKGIIFSGGSPAVYSKKSLPFAKNIFKLKIPILGIGYGLKVIIQLFGGRVKSSRVPEFQRCELFIDVTRNLFWQMPNNITCWMNVHRDYQLTYGCLHYRSSISDANLYELTTWKTWLLVLAGTTSVYINSLRMMSGLKKTVRGFLQRIF